MIDIITIDSSLWLRVNNVDDAVQRTSGQIPLLLFRFAHASIGMHSQFLFNVLLYSFTSSLIDLSLNLKSMHILMFSLRAFRNACRAWIFLACSSLNAPQI